METRFPLSANPVTDSNWKQKIFGALVNDFCRITLTGKVYNAVLNDKVEIAAAVATQFGATWVCVDAAVWIANVLAEGSAGLHMRNDDYIV